LSLTDLIIRLVVMALVTWLIRMMPFALVRRKIENRFIRSLLYYLPYAVLAAMILPDIFYATNSFLSAAVGLAVAVVVSLLGGQLLGVALSACLGVYITEFILRIVETGTISF